MFWLDLTFESYEDAMVFRVLIFLFRTNAKKGCLNEYVFRHCFSNFFESAILKVTWWQPCLVFLLNMRGTLTTAFGKTSYRWRFYGRGSRYVLILSWRLEQTSWNKNRRTNIRACTSKKYCTKIDDISHVFIRFFFS